MGTYERHHAGLILRAARRGVLYCTRDENQEPTFFVLKEPDVPVTMKIYQRDRATIMLAVLRGLLKYEKYLPHNYHLGTGQLRLTAAGERHYEAAMKHLREKEHCRDEKHKPRRQERRSNVPSYQCRMGCGQTLLTETARDIHEENCNGGGDE